MTGVLIVKATILGIMWTIGWLTWFAHTYADVNPKNLGIAFAPWIMVVLYFLLFWWG
jgi:hypothetical protein